MMAHIDFWHRASNEAFRRDIQRYGFVQSGISTQGAELTLWAVPTMGREKMARYIGRFFQVTL
jgi:hypothetical protein